MSMKEIDLKSTVYDLTETYPELIEIFKEIGFAGLANPLLRKTIGRKTTLLQGCKKQGKDVNEVIKKLEKEGFKVKL